MAADASKLSSVGGCSSCLCSESAAVSTFCVQTVFICSPLQVDAGLVAALCADYDGAPKPVRMCCKRCEFGLFLINKWLKMTNRFTHNENSSSYYINLVHYQP